MRRAAAGGRRGLGAAAAALALVAAGCGAAGDGPSGAAGSGPIAPETIAPETIARELGGAVWRVEVDGCGIESGGSSFATGPDLFITNRHVVEFDTTPRLVSRDGATVLEARVIGMSDEVDLAVLEVDDPVASFLEWAPTGTLSEGQRVIAIGYPSPYETFSVSVGTLNAFEVVDGVRVGIISDESSDYGSSGAPLLTDRGLVAGIVTEFAQDGGRQVLGISLSHDAVRSEIARIVAAPQALDEDCTGAAFGSDPFLDLLWGWCADDAMWACDELFLTAIDGTEYASFGATCGDRVDTEEWCTVLHDAPEAFAYGDVAELDDVWRDCDSGVGEWAAACDVLYEVAPLDTEYHEFGATCGRRDGPSTTCVERYG